MPFSEYLSTLFQTDSKQNTGLMRQPRLDTTLALSLLGFHLGTKIRGRQENTEGMYPKSKIRGEMNSYKQKEKQTKNYSEFYHHVPCATFLLRGCVGFQYFQLFSVVHQSCFKMTHLHGSSGIKAKNVFSLYLEIPSF